MLDVLLDAAGDLVSKDTLIARAWPRQHVTAAAVSKRLHELRRVLADAHAPRYLEIVPREGFRFIAPVRPPSMIATRLVGRARELAHIRQWQRQTALGTQLTVAVSGEPGVGDMLRAASINE